MNLGDDNPLADGVPAADSAEQRQPVDPSTEVAGLLHRDANASDVIDQAIVVPLPDDDPDTDTPLL